MKIMLSSGVILNVNNSSVAQQYLKYGAVEYKEEVVAKETTPKKTTKRSATKVASA